MSKHRTIAQVVQGMSPGKAAIEADDLARFLGDPESSIGAKDYIWLELLERRAKGQDVAGRSIKVRIMSKVHMIPVRILQ